MKLTLRHAWIHSLMIFIMLGAAFLAVAHHHSDGDGMSVEQTCEFCFILQQMMGVLPSDISLLLALLASPFVFFDIVYSLVSLPLFFLPKPRAPPVPC